MVLSSLTRDGLRVRLTRAELLAADLTCARDHVAFVEKEVRRLKVPVCPATAQPVANGAVGVTDRALLKRLKRYLDAGLQWVVLIRPSKAMKARLPRVATSATRTAGS